MVRQKAKGKRQNYKAKFKIFNFELYFFLLPFSFCLLCAAADEGGPLTDDTLVVKQEGAHHLLLPKDWPVQYQEGRVTPVPIEEYLSMKFGQIKDAFDQTNQRLESIEQRLDLLERDQTRAQQRLQRLESASTGR